VHRHHGETGELQHAAIAIVARKAAEQIAKREG